MHDISSDEEPLIPSGRNVVPRLSGAEFAWGRFPVHRMSSPQTLVEAGSAGCTLVDPLDSFCPVRIGS